MWGSHSVAGGDTAAGGQTVGQRSDSGRDHTLGGAYLASHPLALPCLPSPSFGAATGPPHPSPPRPCGGLGTWGWPWWAALHPCSALRPILLSPERRYRAPQGHLLGDRHCPQSQILAPASPLAFSSQPCSLCPPGCLLCDTSMCPRWVLWHRGVPLAGVGTTGRPPAAGPMDEESRGGPGGPQTFPGVRLPLLWGLPQHGPRHRMVHGWQRGAGREAVSGCRRWAGGGCRGCGRQREGESREAVAGRGEQAAEGSEAEAGREAAGGSGRQGGRQQEAGRNGSLQPPPARCQPSVPTTSLAADVSRCLPLPRCQVSQQTLPAHARPRGTGRGENPIPTQPPTMSHRAGLPRDAAPRPGHR